MHEPSAVVPCPRFRFVHVLLRAGGWQDRPEFARICDWWRGCEPATDTGVCVLVGTAGAGKTAITDHLLRRIPAVLPQQGNLPKDSTLPTPAGVFAFSFYAAPSPDDFFAQLRSWLSGDGKADRPRPPPRTRIAYAKKKLRAPFYDQTRHLLERAAGDRTPGIGPLLLVLDGFEEVQDDGLGGGTPGQIADDSLRDLIGRVAEGHLRGVAAVVTTRFPIASLEEDRPPFYLNVAVDEISIAAGIALLRQHGIRASDHDLARVVEAAGRHALTVDLIAGYIAEFGGGDPNTILRELGTEKELAAAAGEEVDPRRRAVLQRAYRLARVARRYREDLAKANPAALALLERVCLFRLGVDDKKLAEIFTGPHAVEVAGPELASLSPKDLGKTFRVLQQLRLLQAGSPAPAPVPAPGARGVTADPPGRWPSR